MQALFLIPLKGFWCPTSTRQAITGHGTLCSVSLDDSHMCSWKIIHKPPGESTSRGYLGELLGIFSDISVCSFCLSSFFHHGQMFSPVRRDAHFGEVCARKGKLLEVTSTLSVESKISLCPLQIISSEKRWRIACPCKISQGGCFNDIPAVWHKKRQKEECHQWGGSSPWDSVSSFREKWNPSVLQRALNPQGRLCITGGVQYTPLLFLKWTSDSVSPLLLISKELPSALRIKSKFQASEGCPYTPHKLISQLPLYFYWLFFFFGCLSPPPSPDPPHSLHCVVSACGDFSPLCPENQLGIWFLPLDARRRKTQRNGLYLLAQTWQNAHILWFSYWHLRAFCVQHMACDKPVNWAKVRLPSTIFSFVLLSPITQK